jgi:hypothetical protein
MDVNWQHGDSVANPADAALGPQAYDNHLYYSFGGVADATPEAYLSSICSESLLAFPSILRICSLMRHTDLKRIQNDAALGNSPLWFGEWAISTNFNATDQFLSDWADAQKMAYSQGAGWIVRVVPTSIRRACV